MIEMLRKYIRFHANGFEQIVISLLLRTKRRGFCWMFNLWMKISRKDVRFVYSKRELRYYATAKALPGRKVFFKHERQGLVNYRQGLSERANSIGKTYFLEGLQFNDGDVVVDCGANLGDLKLWFDIRGMNISYIGFEPSPEEFGCLQDNIGTGVAKSVGLWNKEGSFEFFVSSQKADSSLIEPKHYESVIEIPTIRLEDALEGPVKLLKLEAEGGEPEILEGLGERLADVHFITADLGYERGMLEESTLVPVVNFLLERGFSIRAISHDRIVALFENNIMGGGK
ncbi:MAG: hypothetical protein CMB04_03220 [Euryarchaeota archaeon]|nr:hypothetical protein [Euryarchaeota archaeon]